MPLRRRAWPQHCRQRGETSAELILSDENGTEQKTRSSLSTGPQPVALTNPACVANESQVAFFHEPLAPTRPQRDGTLRDILRAAGAADAEVGRGVDAPVTSSSVATTTCGGMRLYAAAFRSARLVRSRTIAPPGLHLALAPYGHWHARLGGRTITAEAGPALIAFRTGEALPIDGELDARGGAAVFGLHLPWPSCDETLDPELIRHLGNLAAAGTVPLGSRVLHLAQRAVALPPVPKSLIGLHLQARLFDVLLALSDAPPPGLRRDTWSRHRRIADAARDILEDELAAPPDMATLARRLGTSVRVLRDAFQARHGKGLLAFLTECRLQRAHALLLESELGISEIAAQVGYGPAAFSTAFARRFGVAPRRLREP